MGPVTHVVYSSKQLWHEGFAASRACRLPKHDRACLCHASRRDALGVLGAGIASGLVWPQPADAVKTVQRRDGTSTEAFQFDIPLRIVSLAGTVPAEWEQDFKQAVKGKIQFKMDRRSQVLDIYQELNKPQVKNSAATADVVTLGDAFLGPAVRNGLIQPLSNARHEAWWDLVSPGWQRLIRRDGQGAIDNDGQVYGVPYSWGCTLIAYRNDKLNARHSSHAVQDWKDLLQPGLRGKLGMSSASSREFMAIVFKTLGLPLNPSLDDLENCHVSMPILREQVAKLRKQVQFVDEREAGMALQAGDISAAIGSSQDLIPIAQRHNNISLVAPASGTILWSNMWVVPQFAQQRLPNGQTKPGASPVLPAWLLFGLEPARASRRRGLQAGASPLLLPFSVPQQQCPNPVVLQGRKEWINLELSKGDMLPTEEVLRRSEFLEPLSPGLQELFWEVLQ